MKKRGIKHVTLGILGGLILTANAYASTGIVNVDNLNVRSGPSTKSSIVNYVHLGEKLEILSTNNNWHKINMNQLTNAYVHSKYVDVSNTSQIITKAELRNAPNLYSNIITTVEVSENVTIIYQTKEWFYVSTSKGKGYIHKDYLSSTNKSVSLPTTNKKEAKQVASVKANILNVRQQPSTSSKKIGQVYRYNTFEIINELQDWVSIKTYNGSIGYIYKKYVDITDELTITNTSNKNQQVINYAKQFVGNPYVWGGNSLTRGVDCSGFTQQVMKKYGINISRTARTQINNGYRVSKKDLLPGDLIFFGYNNKITHVALYMGNNQIVHARNKKYGIVIDNLNVYMKYTPYIGATRVIY
ncbi:MAG: SH3 domain-containing protein [Vallitalea sp.]|jgi:cell wall-associated NlpC family hydrolase|nr:SH3 domain-containing protein [Vallitalea sp.]